MKKRRFNSRGAVSIFLVIVLVPTIVCSSLFVDASRVKSATEKTFVAFPAFFLVITLILARSSSKAKGFMR